MDIAGLHTDGEVLHYYSCHISFDLFQKRTSTTSSSATKATSTTTTAISGSRLTSGPAQFYHIYIRANTFSSGVPASLSGLSELGYLLATSQSVGDIVLSYPRAATLDNTDRRRASQQQQRGLAQDTPTQGSHSRRTSQAEQSLPVLPSQLARDTSAAASSQSVTSSEQRRRDRPESLAFSPAQAQQQLLFSNRRNIRTGIISRQVALRPAQQGYSVSCYGQLHMANSSSGWLLKCCPSDSRILVLFHRRHSTPKCSQTIKVSAKFSGDLQGVDGDRLYRSP